MSGEAKGLENKIKDIKEKCNIEFITAETMERLLYTFNDDHVKL